jgi:uncharacterized protein (DUF433 family)
MLSREKTKVHSPSPPSSPARGEDVDRSIMPITDRIEINSKVMLGKPVIRGTRITVELILRKIKERASPKELLEAYPRLTREDVKAAIQYGKDRGV